MKSYKFFLVVAAAAAFSACTSEEGPKTAPTGDSGEAMTFAVKNNNMSRGAGLETVSKDFGVWGYKTDGSVDAVKNSTKPVMANYIVGYIDNTNPNAVGSWPIPAGVTTTYGSPWLYELFTNNENKTQYLKYWDYSQTHYFFYAYAPYVMDADAPTFTNSTLTLDFGDAPMMAGVAGATDTYSYMYACARVDKSAFGQYVSMEFKRLFAQVQIGFYETIPGYTIQILDAYNIPTDMGAHAEAYNAASGAYGSVAYAMSRTDTGNTITNPVAGEPDITEYTYIRGRFVYRVTPKVFFTETTGVAPSGTVSYDDAWHTPNPIGWAAPTDTEIGNTPETASMSATTYNVIPVNSVDGETAVGYRMFVTFQLTAEDTGETITVYNAPVYIDATYADWEPNKLYKYIFKITKGAGGTTTGPNEPDDEIDPIQEDGVSLYPIVFNNLTVTDLENGGTTEFNISN